MARLDGKVCLITGAATGLGRTAAELFAAEGADVVIADVGDGTEAVEGIAAAGGRAAFVSTDVTDEDSVRAAVEFAVAEFGGLHVLYNNAGVSLADDDGVVNTGTEVWDTTLRVNVTGVALGCKHGIPAMLDTVRRDRDTGRTGGASIINVASFVAHLGAATPQIAYTASKGAVLSMTREIAVIHAREGIRANALCPGPVLTPLLAKYLDDDAKR
ncbi:MAG: SDR family NAD(P)-dependent oxidoreductase, partial [Microthrixaceae bacterium]